MIAFYASAKRALALALIASGSAASAESFSMSLGDRTLGTLDYSVAGGVETMTSTMNNTPLGVFNGTFQGKSNGRHYSSASKSSRKTRDISVLFDAGRAIETVVNPADERTELSDPTLAPTGVIDPVATLGRFINTNGCPEAFRIYDGRRAILVLPVASTQTDSTLVCDMSYSVSHGPGHLSPLYLKSISIKLTYDVSGNQSLSQMQFGAGGFDLTMALKN